MNKTSMAITKKYGDIGSPCRRPFELLKKPSSSPLILIENLGEEMHAWIHLIIIGGKPKRDKESMMNSHLTESKALCKSTFMAHLGGESAL